MRIAPATALRHRRRSTSAATLGGGPIDLRWWHERTDRPTVTVMATPDAAMPRWQRSLLPAMLGADHADRGGSGGDLPRSARDWLVDIVMFTGAVGIGIVIVISNVHSASAALLALDIVLGIPACLALWVRRRHPLAVGCLTVGASVVSGLAGGAAIAGVFTAAVYCLPRRALEVFALSLGSDAVYPLLYTAHGSYRVNSLLAGSVFSVVAVTFGAFVRARRELVLSLHERNRRLESEQHWRVAEARRAERARIAREMHDVLAHRISLLSVHAGALEFHPDAPPDEIARAAAVIRVSARAAQEELREVIGVLRTETEGESVEPPQPTLADLEILVAESRRAGMDVRVATDLEAGTLPPRLGRTVYRLVQEALTNARKHAPGQPVSIELTQDPATGITAEVVNRPLVGRAVGAGRRRPHDAIGPIGSIGSVRRGESRVGSSSPGESPVGSGTGLIGIAERVALAGGRLDHTRLPDGGFRLRASLPWPVDT